MHSRIPLLLKTAVLLVYLAVLIVPPIADAAAKPPVTIQILNVSDWHAQLDPLAVGALQIGGAAVISTYWQQDRAANPNTLTLTAGDAFGAAPPVSNFFNEEPAIRAMNLMGFDADTFGNHNFDRGTAHLQQMIELAEFDYVSANLKNLEENLTGVDKMKFYKVGGAKVAVIGITNPEAPTLVFPGSFGTIEVTEPIAAANNRREVARHAGADVVIAITHLGVTGFISGEPVGPLINFANGVSGFDLILGDHTDMQYSGVINGALVHENRSKGLTYARTTLMVDRNAHQVTDKSVEFVTPLASAVTPDPAIVAMLQPYRDLLAPVLNTVIGSSSVFIPRADACGQSAGRICESKVGNVTTDALRNTYGTEFAITNSGGLRADLTCPTSDLPADFCPSYSPPPFPITRGQVLTVLPFGNVVVTLSVNGAQLKTMLENGVSAMPGANGRFPQVSGLCFTYEITAPAGSRVTGAVRQAADGTCTGAPVDLAAGSTYSIAENDFMASGGDGYPNLIGSAVTRDIMDNVLASYVGANSPVSPSIQGRIVCTDANGATAPNCPVVTP